MSVYVARIIHLAVTPLTRTSEPQFSPSRWEMHPVAACATIPRKRGDYKVTDHPGRVTCRRCQAKLDAMEAATEG